MVQSVCSKLRPKTWVPKTSVRNRTKNLVPYCRKSQRLLEPFAVAQH